MNIHKFNVNRKSISHKTIKWIIPSEILKYVKKVNPDTWEVYSQENIKLQPKEFNL